MRVLWLAKRHYTNKDALSERFGRVYEIPREWARAGVATSLELLDYRGGTGASSQDDLLAVSSTPVRSMRQVRTLLGRAAKFRPDVIVASGDCFVGLLALWAARGNSSRVVFDVYDDYRNFGGYRAFLGWDAFGFLLNHADRVLYASKALADAHTGPRPWHLVPNGVSPDRFHSMDIHEARRRTGLDQEGIRWVGYFGGMDADRGVEDLIEAIGLLHARDPRIRLVLCGSTRPGLQVDLPWVDFRGNVEHNWIPDFINACDVVTLPYRRGRLIDMASSCKIAEYLFCGRPLVSTRTPNFTSNFPCQAAELELATCNPGDPVDLARAIEFQLSEGRVATLPTSHTWSAIARETLEVLES